MQAERKFLQKLVNIFQSSPIGYEKIISQTPIQGIVIPGNEQVKVVATRLQQHNFDVRPILYPTVQSGKERLRIVLHAYNTERELLQLIGLLQ